MERARLHRAGHTHDPMIEIDRIPTARLREFTDSALEALLSAYVIVIGIEWSMTGQHNDLTKAIKFRSNQLLKEQARRNRGGP